MGEAIRAASRLAPALRKTGPLSPNQRLLLQRAIALIICASISLLVLQMVPHRTPAPAHAVAAVPLT